MMKFMCFEQEFPGLIRQVQLTLKSSWTKFSALVPITIPKILWKALLSTPQHISMDILVFINSFTPGRCGSNYKSVISKHMLQIKFMSTSWEIALRGMPQNTFDDFPTHFRVWYDISNIFCNMFQVMNRCFHGVIWRHMASPSTNELTN